MKRMIFFLPAALALAGCFPAGGPLADTGTCPAPTLQVLVGEPEAVANGLTYTGPKRVVHPGEAVTTDYTPERLTVEIGEDGLIKRISCG